MSAKKSGGPLIGDNRKARHIYEYLKPLKRVFPDRAQVKSLVPGR